MTQPIVRYLDDHGNQVTATDPKRLIWYSVGCGYWTDDWAILAKTGPGIPCCPKCGMVGMMTTAQRWDRGAAAYDQQNPGYAAFLSENKGHCFGPDGSMLKEWERFKTKKEGGRT